MSTPTDTQPEPKLTIEVSRDRLTAHLRLTAAEVRKLSVAQVMAFLDRSGLKLLTDVAAHLDALFKQPPKGHPPAILLAQGEPPAQGTSHRLRLNVGAGNAPQSQANSIRDRSPARRESVISYQ